MEAAHQFGLREGVSCSSSPENLRLEPVARKGCEDKGRYAPDFQVRDFGYAVIIHSLFRRPGFSLKSLSLCLVRGSWGEGKGESQL